MNYIHILIAVATTSRKLEERGKISWGAMNSAEMMD